MSPITCPRCGESNDAIANYCKNCGHALPKNVAPERQTGGGRETKGPKRKKKTTAGVLLSVVLAVAGGNFGAWAVHKYYHRDQPPGTQATPFNQALMQMAGEMNKACPIMLDQETRMDNVIALDGNSMQYNYTLMHYTKANLPGGFTDYVKPKAIANLRTNPQTKLFRDNHATLIYHYSDLSGAFLSEFSVAPEEYR